jgi:uncharacterized protein with HEPN domain
MSDDRLYLIHIREAIGRIEEYVQDGREAFLESRLIQDAVVRNLQTLAESTQRLSDAFKQAHPDIDWRAIAGFRNVLVHDYLGVDVARVWQIIEKQLPRLKEQLPETPQPPDSTAGPDT